MSDKILGVKVQADIGTYAGDMNKAAAATDKVGAAADRAGAATKKQGDASEKAADSNKRRTQSTDESTTSQQRNNEETTRAVVNTQELGTALVVVGGSLTAVAAAAMSTGIAYNTLQQQSRAALTTLLGTAEQANAQMDQLDEFARTSPFAKDTFITAQQQMLAFGIETRKVIPYLDAVQDAVAASGGTNADISGLVATMSKIQSSAKLTAQDLMEFGNRGVDAASLIGSQMDMTGAQVRNAITSGSLDATEALDALAAGMSERFGGAAENVKNTAVGAFDRVKAAWRDLSSELAEPFVSKNGGGMLVDLLNVTADVMRDFQALPGPVKTTAAAILFLGGAAALAGGTFLLMRPKVIALKTEIASLELRSRMAGLSLQQLDKAAMLRNMAKGGLVLAGMAVAASDLTEKFEGATTISYALMGAMAGPLGVAIGTTLGLMTELSNSTADLEERFASAREALGGANTFADQDKALAALSKNVADYSDVSLKNLSGWKVGLQAALGMDNVVEKQRKDFADLEGNMEQYRGALQLLEDRTVGAKDGVNELFDAEKMQGFYDRAKPILEGLGIDIEEVLKAGPESEQWAAAEAALAAYGETAGSATGPASDLAEAVASTGTDLMSAAESAKALDDALSALFNPAMDYDKATSAWYEGLEKLEKVLQGNKATVDLTTTAGRENNAAIREQVGALQDQIVAAAQAGESNQTLAAMLRDGRQAFIDTATDAGWTKEAISSLLDEYNLTPDLVQTVIEEVGAAEAQEAARAAAGEMDNLDGTTAGLFITPPATGPPKAAIDDVSARLTSLGRQVARPSISVSIGNALTQIASVGARLDEVIRKKREANAEAYGGFYPGGAPAYARGGFVDGVPRYARGHLDPHIARAGVPRAIYAEPETQGESFIPHAMDRRSRATEILGLTADKFGYDLMPKGREQVRGAVVMNTQEAPLVGSLVIGGETRRERRDNLELADRQLRKIKRGGRSW
ncbi:tape measure protein [Aeromicrobium sp. Leaf291]|uniref:tape measure protein n=1 Tax=Aeromicrobium sp. Leaf291 TaxID=1736325 RepID=UPI0006F1F603|nr:tape measure protein [Aeromicrobium sp. Leaf291]KQP81569.1 hypothetical protein ASF35_16190 [Aeromicrobium sp. Leaf291]